MPAVRTYPRLWEPVTDMPKRNAKGQFTAGNAGGPGRPKKTKHTFSEAELRRIALPIEPAEAFLLARKTDELSDAVKLIMNGESFSDEAKSQLRAKIENQRLAAILLNQRLRQEIKLTLG